MLSEYTSLRIAVKAHFVRLYGEKGGPHPLVQARRLWSSFFSYKHSVLALLFYIKVHSLLSTYNHVGSQNAQKWQFVWASPPVAFTAPRMMFFLFFSFFKRRNARVRNQKRYFFFSLFRLFHRRVFGGRWRNEMVFFSLFPLKIPLFKGFFRAVSVLFSSKRAGGKVVFFHFVQGVRVQKKPHAAGIRSTRLRCLLWYFFLFFFPSYLRSRRSAGVSFWGSTGVGGDIVFFALQGKYNIAILLGQATPGIFPGVSTINTFNIQLAISIPYFSNNPLFSPFSDHSTQTLWQV